MYDKNLKIILKILKFKIVIYEKSKSIKENSNKSVESKKIKENNNQSKQINEELELKNVLKIIFKIYNISNSLLKKILKHITINEFNFILGIGKSDSYNTAISYGKTSALIYSTFSRIIMYKQPKKYKVLVLHNFLSTSNNMNFKFEIKLNLIYVAIAFLNYAKNLNDTLKLIHEGE